MRRERRRNGGLRKRCGCPRKTWTKCPHSWHFNLKVRGGPHYRICLDREVGKHIDSKAEAVKVAADIRAAILAGTFRAKPEPAHVAAPPLTFRAFAEVWKERRGKDLVSAPLDKYRLSTICKFALPATDPLRLFGDLPLEHVTADHIETFRDARKRGGLSAVSINHDLRLLRKMFNWAVRKGYLQRTPFRIGTEPSISLEREIPRNRRLPDAESEQQLLDAANPHLRGVITAMLDTACRPGEVLSLQWKDVSVERRELTIRAEKEKTRRQRIIPISTRLLAILEMRRTDPAGREFSADDYVFGDPIGRHIKSVREAWNNAVKKANLGDLQLRDLRHEAGSRFDEAGMPINYVSNMLGHSNLSTTSRYLNINRRGLHLAMRNFERRHENDAGDQRREEQSDAAVAHALHKADKPTQAVVQQHADPEGRKTTLQ